MALSGVVQMMPSQQLRVTSDPCPQTHPSRLTVLESRNGSLQNRCLLFRFPGLTFAPAPALIPRQSSEHTSQATPWKTQLMNQAIQSQRNDISLLTHGANSWADSWSVLPLAQRLQFHGRQYTGGAGAPCVMSSPPCTRGNQVMMTKQNMTLDLESNLDCFDSLPCTDCSKHILLSGLCIS